MFSNIFCWMMMGVFIIFIIRYIDRQTLPDNHTNEQKKTNKKKERKSEAKQPTRVK